MIEPLLLAHSALISQIIKYDDQLRAMARSDETVRRLMTVPGVGAGDGSGLRQHGRRIPRFRRASDIGAYLG